MKNPIKPEVIPYALRALVALICFGAYAWLGKPVNEVDVGTVVNMIAALFLGKELLPRIGEGK